MLEAMRRWAWRPICFVFGHNYVVVERKPLIDCVRCLECGHEKTGEPSLKWK